MNAQTTVLSPGERLRQVGEQTAQHAEVHAAVAEYHRVLTNQTLYNIAAQNACMREIERILGMVRP